MATVTHVPTTIGILTPKGLVAAPYTAASFLEAAQQEPEGVYTVTRTYRRYFALLLDAHLDRMEESARLEWIKLKLRRSALRAALRSLIGSSGYAEARFRITAPRENPDNLILTLTPFEDVPAEARLQGVKMATVQIERQNPRSKTTDWMKSREAARARIPKDAYEGLLVNVNGEILEGFQSNFYAVIDGTLYTAGKDVLSGISRRIIFEVAPRVLPVTLDAVHLTMLPEVEDAFLTSSSRGVVPITRINDTVIGSGKPGILTQEISQRYNEWVESHLECI